MKKSLLALAVLGAFAGTAAAQVTVYGQLEAGFGTRDFVRGNVSRLKTTGVQDSVLGASRWGIRGSEDLGNGLKGVFALETTVSLAGDTNMFGTVDSLGMQGNNVVENEAGFSPRLGYVGLQGGFGTVTLGRDNNPIHSVAAASDVDGRNGFSPTSNLYEGTNRGQAITYTSPNFGGFTVRAQYAREAAEVRSAANVVEDDYKGDVLALAAAYANGPLTVGVGYQILDTENTAGGGVAADRNERKHWIVGGAYDLKVVKLFANAQQRKIDLNAGVRGNENREYNLGVSAPIGAFTLVAAAGRNEQTSATNVKTKGTDYVVGANYSLSKRTFAYARHGRYDTIGTNENKGFQVGVRHAF